MNPEEMRMHATEKCSEKNQQILLSPVLIVGSSRSGTTWLQRLLLELPGVAGGQESHFFLAFKSAFDAIEIEHGDHQRTIGLPAYWQVDEFHQAMREVWMKTFHPLLARQQDAHLLIEKTPGHALHLDRIAGFLPQARFIHMIRDSRAVSASLVAASQGWGKNWAPGGIRKAALRWRRTVEAAHSAAVAGNPQRYLEVHYEDLQRDPVAELQRIAAFIGLHVSLPDLQAAVQAQAFDKQKLAGGTGIMDAKGNELKEPQGFFRKGQVDSWRSDLNLIQKLVVWLYTHKLMRACGYTWSGRKS